ncbi:MAG: hypothetical protein IGS49_19375 [Chlorogloeopsis fritschii C42_A2020_084]|uniref:hypothetical protein n=1 Tax=Chlorogloeopsis fritschii TaxID=1124 RepID=UPI0019E2F41B|nr:hypothetical protein [Chlorogloeopsis fritschii]MBF2007553.1 hypothetical protein [Chlorogloeopsis fritschii C42_A2020_084]
MNKMLQEVLRWQRTTLALPSQRWLAWAESLNRGRDRLSLLQGLLTMSLEQRYPLVRIYQQWQTQTWQLLPQINLSISSILREIERRESSTSWLERIQDQSSPISLQTRVNTSILRLEQNHSIPAIASVISIQPSPVQQVFNRLEPAMQISYLHHSAFVQQSQKIVQRVVRDRQRLEERVQNNLLVKQPLEVKDAIARTLNSSPHHLTTDIPQNFQPNPPPNSNTINLNQLTEQVLKQLDSRIIAQRERMGRTF